MSQPLQIWNLHQDLLDALKPLMVLKHQIESATAMKPTGVVLPDTLRTEIREGLVSVLGLPVIWDHRPTAVPSLTYTPVDPYSRT